MDDETLLRAFESCTLPPEALGHREHVRVAWSILRAHPRFEDGAQRVFEHGVFKHHARQRGETNTGADSVRDSDTHR